MTAPMIVGSVVRSAENVRLAPDFVEAVEPDEVPVAVPDAPVPEGDVAVADGFA